ncbi:DNA-binding protein [Nocardiopsis oceani]
MIPSSGQGLPPRPAGTPVPSHTAAAIRASSARVIALDTRFGARELVGPSVRAAVRAHRAAQAPSRADRDVLAASAEAHQVAGWICFDAERQDLSRRMTLETVRSARSAGDRSMEYFALSQLAMQDVHLNRPAEAESVCGTVADEDVAGAVATLFTLRRARAAAQRGERARAQALIGETYSRYLEGPRPGDPAWAWWVSVPEIAWHHGMILAELGEWPRSAERFTAAADGPGYQRAEIIAQTSLLWALAHARAWPEAEEVLVNRVLPRIAEVGSVRAERQLAEAGALLQEAPRSTLSDAARLLQV